MTSTITESTSAGPLAGLRVLDMSRILAGPYCTQLLGDMGADIIKVERPGVGDDTRSWGPPYVTTKTGDATRESAYYLSANRNKRSIAVDMADPNGAKILRQLATQADVVIQNFKVGGLEKYGLDYAALHADNAALIYCSISGFGQTGPFSQRPGYDLLAQGFGGIMSLTGDPQGEPIKVGVGIADVMCGMYASNAILAALHHREHTGNGQHIDIALADTQVAWLINEGVNYLESGHEPQRRGNQHPNIVPYQVFEVADGHVIVVVGNDAQFARFVKLIDLPHLEHNAHYATNSARLENRDELVDLLQNRLREMQKEPLITAMAAANVPGGEINTVAEVFASEQVAAREMKISMPHPLAASGSVDLIGNPIKFSKTPVTYRYPPPLCGQHTDEVIAEWLGDKT